MSDTNPQTPPAEGDKAAKAMTAAQAAKLVQRTVVVKDGDEQKEKLVAVKADEVLSFRDYGSHVVVVTVDGQKLSGPKAAGQAKV